MLKFNQKQIFIPSILKIGEGEINNTGKYLEQEGFHNAAIFYSEGIEELFGGKILKSLELSKVKADYVKEITEINIESVIHRAFKIPKHVDVLVGVGGGKALDYAKYCAHVLTLPFVSVPTSTSNDGFCSPNSSLLVAGRRKSVSAKIPYGVIVDIAAIKTSPDSCIYSGIGDLISKITAGHDWLMAARKNNESFNDFANMIANNTVSEILCAAESILEQGETQSNVRNPQFLYHLTNSLLMNGISMEIAGSSRPASGSEHLISHAYDKIAEKPSMHGIQVGIATYICSYLQDNRFKVIKDFLQGTGFFEFVAKNPLDKEEFIQAVELAPSMKEDFFTVLSSKKNLEKAIIFIEENPICSEVLK